MGTKQMSIDSYLNIDPNEEMRKVLTEYDGEPFAGSKIDFEHLMETLESTVSSHPEIWWARNLNCSVCGFDEVMGWREGIGYFCRVHATKEAESNPEPAPKERAKE